MNNGTKQPDAGAISSTPPKPDSPVAEPPSKRTRHWTNIILGSNFILVLLTFLAGSFSKLKIDKCLVADHPVKVLMLFALVVGVIWATDLLVHSDWIQRRLLHYGVVVTLVIWTATGLLILNEHKGWIIVQGHDNWVMAVAFAFILGLILKALLTEGKQPQDADDETGMSAQSLKKWGDVVALAIMMLAMFFLALEFKPEGFRVKWEEIPAILMVFLLAELAVALVVTASKIRQKVTAAADVAERVMSRAEEVQRGLAENQQSLVAAKDVLIRIEEGADESIGQLRQTVTALTELAQMEMLFKSVPEFCRLGAIERNDFWTQLNQFTTDWTPNVSEHDSERNHGLVGVLFKTFIGGDASGTVRRTPNAVSCVTVDSVFADASAEWLKRMAQVESHEHHKLKVWAVTSLLPTDFALPHVWWSDVGSNATGVTPRRTRTLERFIDSVIEECKSKSAVGEYRRITVFPNNERLELGADGLNAWQRDFASSLDNWLLWDPRVQKNSGPNSLPNKEVLTNNINLFADKVKFCTVNLAQALMDRRIKNGETLKPLNAGIQKMSWPTIQGMYEKPGNGGSDIDVAKLRDPRTLPNWNGTKTSEFNFFFNDFAIHENQPVTGGVIGVNDDFLDYKIEVNDLAALGCEPSLVNFIKGATKEADLALRDIYQMMGWITLREWYRRSLHLSTNETDEGAWWAVSKYADVAEDPVLRPFKLMWDDYEVVTLDLLLIGPLYGNDGSPSRDWYGAAISNISFDRTECTVQLVTNQKMLEKIAEAVEDLSANFTTGESDKVSSHGTWKDWPKGFTAGGSRSKIATAQ